MLFIPVHFENLQIKHFIDIGALTAFLISCIFDNVFENLIGKFDSFVLNIDYAFLEVFEYLVEFMWHFAFEFFLFESIND